MPDPFARHARTADSDWGPNPSRSQQRRMAASDDPLRSRAPGRKDPSLCKALHWKGAHAPVLRLRYHAWRRSVKCRWALSWRSRGDEPSWHCEHEEICSGCGKVLRTDIGDAACPDYHPMTKDESRAIEEGRAEAGARMAAWYARRRPAPVIDGPQGYRKKRSA